MGWAYFIAAVPYTAQLTQQIPLPNTTLLPICITVFLFTYDCVSVCIMYVLSSQQAAKV